MSGVAEAARYCGYCRLWLAFGTEMPYETRQSEESVKRQDCKSMRSVVLASIVAAMSTSSGVTAELEPNNNRAQANALTFNASNQATTTGRVNPLNDLDFFSVTTPSFVGQGTLVVTMTPTSADRGLDAWMQLQNSTGTLLAERDFGFDHVPESLTNAQIVANTTYFIVSGSADFSSAGSGDYSLRADLILPRPNLAPYQPSGWSDRIVVSKSAGTTSDGTGLTSTNILYVDWAILNSGNAGTPTRFHTELHVDGVLRASWFADPPLNADFFINVQDHALGPLSPGTYTLRIIADSTGVIAESNESDNEYTKTITVADDDPNDQLSGALVLGGVNSTLTMPGAIDAPTDVDVFSFTVMAGQRVTFDIDQTSGWDSHLRLFNADGAELAANNDGAGPGEMSGQHSYLEHTFTTGGTFYMGLSGFSNTNYNPLTGVGDANGSVGSYTFVVSPGLAGTIRRGVDTADYLVDLLRFGANPVAINTNQRTWIVVHGWMSSRANPNIFDVASALFQTRPGDQVLTLDWSTAASTVSPFLAEDSIVAVAQLAASALNRHGLNGTNINLVGHSFGSYVSDEVAQRIPGGVNTIVTLDPAADVLGGYEPDSSNEVNFAEHSFFSWSFHSSSLLGNEFTPTTADESFVVTNSSHGSVGFLFAYMLMHPTDLVSQFFLLTDLLNGTFGPWLPNEFSSLDSTVQGYEAVIDTTDNGTVPVSLTFVRLPSLAIAKTGDVIAMAWSARYTDFLLQSSTLDGLSGPWDNVSVQPTIVGEFNVVTLPRTEAKRFFRLIRP